MGKEIVYLSLQLFQSVFTICMFGLIPFLWYWVTRKKLKGVLAHLGIKRAEKGAYAAAFTYTGLAYLFTIAVYICLYMVNGGMETFPMRREYEACSPAVLVLMVTLLGARSGIGEELFFRGFLGKRLIGKLGFKAGNILQALIFILPHILTFHTLPLLESILLLVNAGIMGYTFGYITEKKAGGSIVPGMLMHGLVNMVAVPIVWFIM